MEQHTPSRRRHLAAIHALAREVGLTNRTEYENVVLAVTGSRTTKHLDAPERLALIGFLARARAGAPARPPEPVSDEEAQSILDGTA